MANHQLNQIKEQFVDQLAEYMKTFGLSATLGRVFGIIYLKRRPMTLTELSEATGMSKTRMSQVVREMSELGIAEKVFVRGIRQDLYDVERDFHQIFISLFSETWSRMIRTSRKQEKRIHLELSVLLGQNDLSKADRKIAEEYLEEAKKKLDFCNWLNQLVEFFESDSVFQHIHR